MFKIKWLAVLACLPVMLGTAHATTITNLLTNGSFETGDFTGWTITGTLGANPQPTTVIITDGVNLTGASSEPVPADNAVSSDSDPAGTHGAYFVDDTAHQFLTQQLFLVAGHYDIGFDAYSPTNGFNNPVDATFKGTIAGVLLANYTLKSTAAATWLHFSGIADVATSAFYSVAFEYETKGDRGSPATQAADVVIDRVYVGLTDAGGGTAIPSPTVPEPGTLSFLGLGLAVCGLAKRRCAKK
jgi:hypothetical protein